MKKVILEGFGYKECDFVEGADNETIIAGINHTLQEMFDKEQEPISLSWKNNNRTACIMYKYKFYA